MTAIEKLKERIRGLRLAQDSAGSQEERDYIQRLIDGYEEEIRRLEGK